jgi:hypothetical protein
MKYKFALVLIAIIFLLFSCATHKPQYKNDFREVSISDKELVHSFYLIGDAGYSPNGSSSKTLELLKKDLQFAPQNSTTIFLGDNIYPKGLPSKNDKKRKEAEHNIQVQIDAVENYKGKTIFIPGNHDWYSNGLKGLKRQEDFIDDALGKNSFLPENGCPIEHKSISDSVELIIIDSKWYLTNWDNHPTINDECDIKTREAFFDEYESKIKKARGKTTIVAMHHPMFTNGPHGGQYSLKDHMKPIPILGTAKNVLRKSTGASPEDIQNKRYNEFRKRIITISQENDKVIFVSGHEHSLQHIEKDNLVQIISGSGSKKTATRNVGGGLFSYGQYGYSRLDVFNDGSSQVRFFTVDNNQAIYEKEVFSKQKEEDKIYSTSFPSTIKASIYTVAEVDKSSFYKFLWGERYATAYSTIIEANTVSLDTLFGGLTPIRKGGGTQSNSLRLRDSNGKEYVMRGLRKNALNFIQALAFKDQYVEGQFDDTAAEELLFHVFAGSYPYAPLVTATLSDAINVLHTNPELYYVPRQKAIGPYNDTFGDELYMIEEHAGDNHGDKASFGYSDELISTTDMFLEIHSDEDVAIDEAAYIRARILDMLLGDWDRHQDQWRWAKTKKDNKTVYIPMPRDRDQVFSNMSDGLLLGIGTKLIPAARKLKGYQGDLKNPKWFNVSPYPLDMAVIDHSDKSVWDEQVKIITTNLTDEVIDEAFLFVPKELQNETLEGIKNTLKVRLTNLQKITDKYYYCVSKYAVIKGTDKDDWFEIERQEDGNTKVTAYRIKNGKKADVFHERVYNKKITKEIWIYALDDDDVMHVIGDGNNPIRLRLIGGQNNDIYNIEDGRKVKAYDYKSKENTFKTKKGSLKLIDDYETNVYDYKKLKNNANQFLPIIGFNPDDGVKLGFSNTYTAYGFERNPFSSQHNVSTSYYFSTNGFDLKYSGEFANVIGRLNVGVLAQFTSPNYSVNFFGFGNETINPNVNEQDESLDYNRVKLSTFKLAPSIIKKGELGSEFKLEFSYESIEVEETQDRFINVFYNSNNIENTNNFIGTELSYKFLNRDNSAYPTTGVQSDFRIGYKTNIDNSADFGYFIPSLSFDNNITADGKLVFATKLKGHITFGNEYEFYQAASIGANDGLRGYRNQRFTGKHAYYQLTDVRYTFKKMKTGILPINLGIYGGFDYGRVWLSNDKSEVWHNSYGGGLLIIAAEYFTANISVFNSADSARFAFALGLKF